MIHAELKLRLPDLMKSYCEKAQPIIFTSNIDFELPRLRRLILRMNHIDFQFDFKKDCKMLEFFYHLEALFSDTSTESGRSRFYDPEFYIEQLLAHFPPIFKDNFNKAACVFELDTYFVQDRMLNFRIKPFAQISEEIFSEEFLALAKAENCIETR